MTQIAPLQLEAEMSRREKPDVVRPESRSYVIAEAFLQSPGRTEPVRRPDGIIDYPDGTAELNGYFFERIAWDELDPPQGHPDAEEVPHEVVMNEICEILGIPPGSL
jgi:hypothetical protein